MSDALTELRNLATHFLRTARTDSARLLDAAADEIADLRARLSVAEQARQREAEMVDELADWVDDLCDWPWREESATGRRLAALVAARSQPAPTPSLGSVKTADLWAELEHRQETGFDHDGQHYRIVRSAPRKPPKRPTTPNTGRLRGSVKEEQE